MYGLCADRNSVVVQLFPYHLADYVCRVLRVTPFRYYCDLLFTVMREEKSYDQIPNFTVGASDFPAFLTPHALGHSIMF